MLSGPLCIVELVELLTNSLTTACVLVDHDPERDPHILYVNPAFTRLSGYTREELQGASVKAISGAAEPAVTHRIRSAMRSFRPVRGVKTNVRKTGESYMCEIAVRPVHDALGKVGHYIAFHREVRRRRGRPPQSGQRVEPVTEPGDGEEELFALD